MQLMPVLSGVCQSHANMFSPSQISLVRNHAGTRVRMSACSLPERCKAFLVPCLHGCAPIDTLAITLQYLSCSACRQHLSPPLHVVLFNVGQLALTCFHACQSSVKHALQDAVKREAQPAAAAAIARLACNAASHHALLNAGAAPALQQGLQRGTLAAVPEICEALVALASEGDGQGAVLVSAGAGAHCAWPSLCHMMNTLLLYHAHPSGVVLGLMVSW